MDAFENHKIVVWERSNKRGKWSPYSADVCHLLEESFKKKSDVCLGDVDEDLKKYCIKFNDMVQVSNITGTKCPIRHRLCDRLSVLGRGFSWQWQGDHKVWQTYDADVNDFIDKAFLEGKKSVDLCKEFPEYYYEIDFTKMSQVNKRSKRKRKVQRTANNKSYPTPQCPEDDSESTNLQPVKESKSILNPDTLAEEIPGTTALISQVNAYKGNVQSPNGYNNLEQLEPDTAAGHSSSKQLKISAKKDKIGTRFSISSVLKLMPFGLFNGATDGSVQEQTSSATTTVALVNGKPYTEPWPPDTPSSLLKPVPGIDPLEPSPSIKRKKKGKGKGKGFNLKKKAKEEEPNTTILSTYTQEVDLSSTNNEQCIICCESLSAPSSYEDDSTICKLTLCSHVFHKACIEAMFNSSPKEFLQCPSCKKIHGEKCGIQPPGEMTYHVLPYSLPSYPDNETIRIIYSIRPGIQGPEHPNPGGIYTARGFPRHCYLPDNEMGRKILRLLIKAWKRRLIFTIGQSSTTGEDNTVTWNEIHHKTEFGRNRRGHGYPDPNYFSNVLAELEAHGVIDDDGHEWYPA